MHSHVVRRRRRSPWLTVSAFMLPFFALLVIFKIAPILINIGYSLQDIELTGKASFAGLDNYKQLLGDDLFYTSLGNTMLYLLYVGPINVVFGFLIALLLNQTIKGRTLGRTAVFMPYVIMVTLVGITWRWILDGTNGLLNYYLEAVGLEPISLLTSPNTSMIGIALASIWWTIGYNVVIYLAALQDVPAELVEAAKIDGAGKLRTLWSITLPLMKSTTFFAIITTVIYSMQMFGQVYVMTSGGPDYSTLSIVQYLYIKGFREFDLGYAATLGTALLAVLGALSTIIFLVFRERSALGRSAAPRRGPLKRVETSR